MSLQCGTTSNGCNGKAGLIRIEYVIPDPPSVRYKYPNDSDWKKIDRGVRYTQEQSKPVNFSGGQCQNVLYNIYVDAPAYRVDGSYVGRIIRNLRLRGKITLVGWYVDPFGTNLGVQNNLGESAIGWSTTAGLCPTNCNPGSIDAARSVVTSSITRVDGQPDNCGNPQSGDCTFKVFDVSNQIIFSETRNVCPTAEVMPSVYGNNKGSFNVKNTDASRPLKVVNTETNNLKSTLVQLGATTIKKLDSPSGSTLFPRICWDCEEDKCPSGTCEVDCGVQICCYDSQGIAVKTILKS